jgi:hypothetical protein
MDLICPFVQVMVNFYQSVVNFSWTPFAWLGLQAPSVASWFQPFFPWCTLE